MKTLLLFLSAFAVLVWKGWAHPYHMTETYYCNNYQLTTSQTIMGNKAKSSSARTLTVFRGSTSLSSGATYVAGETLTVHVYESGSTDDNYNTNSNGFVFQTTGATFQNGKCSNKRYAGGYGTLIMPAGGSGAVTVWAGWAQSYGQVYLTSTFTLADPGSSVTSNPSALPTVKPSAVPSAVPTVKPSAVPSVVPSAVPSSKPTVVPSAVPSSAPTVVGQTLTPTTIPSAGPTVSPTVSLRPTASPSTIPSAVPSAVPSSLPTKTPSSIPTVKPTSQPSTKPTRLPTNQPTSKPTSNETSIFDNQGNTMSTSEKQFETAKGVLISIASVACAILIIASYCYLFATGIIPKEYSDSFKALVIFFISLACGVAAIVLVARWVQNDDTSGDAGYLGLPSFDTNPLAWHVALMVGGCFFSQIIAISSWGLFSALFDKDYEIGRMFHGFFQTASAGCMIAGLICIVKHVSDNNLESLTTIHSWIGVAATVMFGITYIFGSMLSIMKIFAPNSSIHTSVNVVLFHRGAGMATFGLIVLAITTGIMSQLQLGSCFYLNIASITPSIYRYPGEHYYDLPGSCKIGNGIGILVVAAAIGVAILVSIRPKKVMYVIAGEIVDVMNGFLVGCAAILLGAAAVVLVVLWVQDSNTSGSNAQLGYLGLPSFYSNPLAWHVALMVGGFYYGQIFAILSWSMLPDNNETQHNVIKAIHASLHFASAGSMIAGLVAIVRHMYEKKLESLTTMHSWLGVAAVGMFGMTYVIGSTMSILKSFVPDSILRKAFNLGVVHR